MVPSERFGNGPKRMFLDFVNEYFLSILESEVAVVCFYSLVAYPFLLLMVRLAFECR